MSGRQRCSTEAIVDMIYEAALVPELWPHVLDQLASLSDTEGGALFSIPSQSWKQSRQNEPALRWICSGSVEGLWRDYARDGWFGERNAWFHRGLKIERSGFMADQDMFSAQEIESEPQYGYLRSKGFGWGAGLFITLPADDILVFEFERRFDEGPIERSTIHILDQFKPHLARSALLSTRLGLERIKASTNAFACLGLPAAVVSTRQRLLSSNELLDEFVSAALREPRTGRIRLLNQEADQILERALHALSASKSVEHCTFSIPVPSVDSLPAFVLHLIPVRNTARDIFTSALAILIITPIRPALAPSAQVIQGLFDLTAAEARVTQLILSGKTISGIADASKTTQGTVRCQLKSVFSKTGVCRQADLISLLGGIQLSPK